MSTRIVTLPGDGIGPEIMEAGLRVLAAAAQQGGFEYSADEHPFGGAGIDACGSPYPEATRVAVHEADAVLLAAIGGPAWNDAPDRPEAGLLRMRQDLGLFANLRPTRVTAARAGRSPLRPEIVAGADFVIVRELTGGIYFGQPRRLDDDEAFDTMRYRRDEVERIARVAFETARTRRGRVTLVDKANVLASSKLWRRVVGEVAVEYPDVHQDAMYVDAAAMKLVSDPRRFDVILTENLFGDILSDEAAEITGSLGTIPSQSRGASGPAVYEPIHGSAPDIAGQGIADPISMIGSISLMLRGSAGRADLADRIEAAVDAAVSDGEVTPDLGGTATTTEATDAIIRHLSTEFSKGAHDDQH